MVVFGAVVVVMHVVVVGVVVVGCVDDVVVGVVVVGYIDGVVVVGVVVVGYVDGVFDMFFCVDVVVTYVEMVVGACVDEMHSSRRKTVNLVSVF